MTWAGAVRRWCAGCTRCCGLVPGGVAKAITAAAAARLLDSIVPAGAVDAARRELAAAFVEDLRRIDAQQRETRKKPAAFVQAAGTSLTSLSGVGPVIAAAVIGDVRDVLAVPQPGPLRRIQRDRAYRGVLRPAHGVPAEQAREPAPQPRHPHGRRHPGPLPAQR